LENSRGARRVIRHKRSDRRQNRQRWQAALNAKSNTWSDSGINYTRAHKERILCDLPFSLQSHSRSDLKDLVNAESPWRDRLRALRNMPPVLRILWESGRTVVSWGVGLRLIVAVLPFAIAKVAQYIINGIAGVLRGAALPSNFWELV